MKTTLRELGVPGLSGADDACCAALEALLRADDAARAAAAEVRAARERLRVARHRAAERRDRAHDALQAGQAMFAAHLLAAAEAHDGDAREASAVVEVLERRYALLSRAARRRDRQLREAAAALERAAPRAPCACCALREVG